MKTHSYCILSLGLLIGAAYGDKLVKTVRSDLYPESQVPPTATSHDFETDAFLQDFSYAGYHNGEQDVPKNQTAVFNVSANGSDTADDTAAIRASITACQQAGGGVVKLPAGTFYVSKQSDGQLLRVSVDNVVIRGAGPGLTKIINTSTNMRDTPVITFLSPGPSSQKYTGSQIPITQDIHGPGRRLMVANAANFSVGDEVVLRWTTTQAWIDENGQSAWWSANALTSRYQREITAVNTAEGWVEINVPIRYYMKTRDNPTIQKLAGRIRECGVEDLSMGNIEVATASSNEWQEEDHTDPAKQAYNSHGSTLIKYLYARNCWVKNVRSFRPAQNTTQTHILSGGIVLSSCFNVSIIDCVMQNPQYGGGGGNGYMYTIAYSNDCLIRSSRAENSRHGFSMIGAGTSGNVLHDCYDVNTGRAVGGGAAFNQSSDFYATAGEGSDYHQHFSHSNLYDMCDATNSRFEAFHRKGYGGNPVPGLTTAHGVYWNSWGEGSVNVGGSVQTNLVISDQGRYGYVIGTGGSMSAVSSDVNFETNTAPADIVEFVDEGEKLMPQSLWLSQKHKRLENHYWKSNDIHVGTIAAGTDTVTERMDKITRITASGADIQGTNDGFRFAYQKMDGDGELLAKVKSFTAANVWAKAGLMIREDTGADSVNILNAITRDQGVTLQERMNMGGSTSWLQFAGSANETKPAAPIWLSLRREGNLFTAKRSYDGDNWLVTGTRSISMPRQVLAGLAVTSHNSAALATAEFQNAELNDYLLNPTDVGGPQMAGYSSMQSWGQIEIHGGGYRMQHATDDLHFFHTDMTGDGTLTARLSSMDNTNSWARAGVMIRESLDPGSKNAATLLTPLRGAIFSRRVNDNQSVAASFDSTITAPRWIRVTRKKNNFTSYVSVDGHDWVQLGPVQTIAMGGRVKVGLCVCAYNNSQLCRAVFDDFSIEDKEHVWTPSDVGVVQMAGESDIIHPGQFVVKGGGYRMQHGTDDLHFVHTDLVGDATVTARLISMENTNSWARAGLMIRDSLGNDAKNAATLITPAGGGMFSRRTVAGQSFTYDLDSTVTAPRWIRVKRQQDYFSSYISQDGVNWTQLGSSQYIPMSSSVKLGMVVCAYNNSKLCKAVFDNVLIEY